MVRIPKWVVMAVIVIAAVATMIVVSVPKVPYVPGTPRPTPSAIPAQAGVPCSDQLPVKECAALEALAGREVRSPCDHAEDFGCTRGHVTRVSLKWAHVHGFTVTRIPASIADLPELTELNLFGNHYLEGPLPPELFTLKKLAVIDIGDNKLSGSIPPEIGNLTSLRYLNLDKNQLTGQIPPEIGRLEKLEYLHLFGNQLDGPIPPEIGGLGHLEELHLGHNALTGSIPAELGNMANLRRLYLHDNRLSGSIPSELGNLDRLEDLVLRQNNFSGELPAEVTRLGHLVRLDISFNPLTGALPGGYNPEMAELWYHQTWLDEPDPAGEIAQVPDHSAVVRYENFDCGLVTTIPRKECDALVDLYLPYAEHTDYYTRRGAPIDYGGGFSKAQWPNAPLFVTGDPCIWFLVYCEDGHVIQLTLDHIYLQGRYPLPESLVDLNHVVYVSTYAASDATRFCIPPSPDLEAWIDSMRGDPNVDKCE